MLIFNILIVLGGGFILIGIYYTFFWSSYNVKNEKIKKDVYKKVDDSVIPLIFGKSYEKQKRSRGGGVLKNEEQSNNDTSIVKNEEQSREGVLKNEDVKNDNEQSKNDTLIVKNKEESNNDTLIVKNEEESNYINGFSIDNMEFYNEELDEELEDLDEDIDDEEINAEEHWKIINKYNGLENVMSGELYDEMYNNINKSEKIEVVKNLKDNGDVNFNTIDIE